MLGVCRMPEKLAAAERWIGGRTWAAALPSAVDVPGKPA